MTEERSTLRVGADAVTWLSIFIVALIAIPSDLIVGPLGRAGTPAEIIGLGLFAGWVVVTIGSRRERRHTRQAIRIFAWLFVLAVAISYVAANSRGMMDAEARSSDAGLLLICSWMGVLLIAMDRIPSRDRLDVLLRRLVFLTGALAALSLLQFATKAAYTNYIQIPGLTENKLLTSLHGRNGLIRPAGTAVHPIELGAELTMVLPLALHYALVDSQRSPTRRWFPVLAIAFAVPISISRSAILSMIIALCFIIPTWSRQVRRRAYAAMVAIFGAVYVMVPGLLGTITHLFTRISGDSSAQSRTDSYSVAFDFIHRAPIFGRGFMTFLPDYRILDDQYLGLLIETGFFGLIVFLGLLVSGVFEGMRLRRNIDRNAASLAISLAASGASALVSFALFDALSFPMAASLIFLILGCIGCHRRLVAATSRPTPSRPLRAPIRSPR